MSTDFSEIYFKAPSNFKHLAIRDVKASRIGHLVCVKGIVTRASEVKPMMTVATYTCDTCGNETYQPVRLSPILVCCVGGDGGGNDGQLGCLLLLLC